MVKPENPDAVNAITRPFLEGDSALFIGASALIQSLTVNGALMERAVMIRAAMVDTLGLDHTEVRLVAEQPTTSGTNLTLIDASPLGQRIGTHKAIYERRGKEPEWYMVEIDGKLIDPLAGCTRAAYNAMIADARTRGVLLPDSLALSQRTREVWTATMLTGEPLDDEGLIIIASSNSADKVNNVGFPLDRGGKTIRVRPAVVVATLEA